MTPLPRTPARTCKEATTPQTGRGAPHAGGVAVADARRIATRGFQAGLRACRRWGATGRTPSHAEAQWRSVRFDVHTVAGAAPAWHLTMRHRLPVSTCQRWPQVTWKSAQSMPNPALLQAAGGRGDRQPLECSSLCGCCCHVFLRYPCCCRHSVPSGGRPS